MVDRVVCNFGPRGNIQGKPVYTIGYPATQCKDDFQGDESFTGLCRPMPSITKGWYLFYGPFLTDIKVVAKPNLRLMVQFLFASVPKTSPVQSCNVSFIVN